MSRAMVSDDCDDWPLTRPAMRGRWEGDEGAMLLPLLSHLPLLPLQLRRL